MPRTAHSRSLGLLVAFAATLAACGGSGPRSPDAAIADAARTDGTREDAGDGGGCVERIRHAECFAHWPSWRCDVPCELPPWCSFHLSIAWTGDLCGARTDQLSYCVCIDGAPHCGLGPYTNLEPISYQFELCTLSDGGTNAGIEDTGIEDAGIEDAGTGDSAAPSET